MAISIHHTLIKKAAKFNIQLKVEENEVVAYLDGNKYLVAGLPAKAVLEQALAKLENGHAKTQPSTRRGIEQDDASEENEGDEHFDNAEEADTEAEEAVESHSIIKSRYKIRYRPFKMTCGDDLSSQISKHVTFKDPETDEFRIDRDRLRQFADANEVWTASYEWLNSGQMRMNIGNRLRARVRKGHEVIWK
jgi:hypothetical protein